MLRDMPVTRATFDVFHLVSDTTDLACAVWVILSRLCFCCKATILGRPPKRDRKPPF